MRLNWSRLACLATRPWQFIFVLVLSSLLYLEAIFTAAVCCKRIPILHFSVVYMSCSFAIIVLLPEYLIYDSYWCGPMDLYLLMWPRNLYISAVVRFFECVHCSQGSLFRSYFTYLQPGPSCLKLMMSLVNVSLKFWSLNLAHMLIFLLKNVSSFKAIHLFPAKMLVN